MNASVDSVRNAARHLVRELHLLDGRVECCGIPLSECHLITELNSMGEATASDLCERLVLEKSTMSRLVNRLVDKGLVCASCCEDDRRARVLCLTAEGKMQAEKVDLHARSQVASALDFVGPEEEKAVIEGLGLYARSLRFARLANDYEIRRIRPDDNASVARILDEVMAEFGLAGNVVSSSDSEVSAMFEAYSGPESAFFVIEKHGEILGCGGMGPLPGGQEGICELRKMYFLAALRGKGMGLFLLRRILGAAREAGYGQCYLETMSKMAAARNLYRKFGFTDLDSRLGTRGPGGCNRYMILDLN